VNTRPVPRGCPAHGCSAAHSVGAWSPVSRAPTAAVRLRAPSLGTPLSRPSCAWSSAQPNPGRPRESRGSAGVRLPCPAVCRCGSGTRCRTGARIRSTTRRPYWRSTGCVHRRLRRNGWRRRRGYGRRRRHGPWTRRFCGLRRGSQRGAGQEGLGDFAAGGGIRHGMDEGLVHAGHGAGTVEMGWRAARFQ
jgi:hypothetical protein